MKEVDAKAAIVTLSNNIEGVLKASELSLDKVEDARNVLKVGDAVEARVVSVDRKNRVVSLSVKAIAQSDEKEAMKAQKEKVVEATGPTTIGDLIKAQMEK